MSWGWPKVSCLQILTCLCWSFQRANGNQFCIFKARWWSFRVPPTSNNGELIPLYSIQMPAQLYISTRPLASGKRGKGVIYSLNIICLSSLKHNPASLKPGLKQWQLNTCAVFLLPQECSICVRFGWVKERLGKDLAALIWGGNGTVFGC